MDLQTHHQKVVEVLKNSSSEFARVLPEELSKREIILPLDLSDANTEISEVHTRDVKALEDHIWGKLRKANAKVGIGGYGEDRPLYKKGSVFTSGEEPRSVHLGIDLWTEAETPLTAPLAGKIHSFKDNASFRNYGPTIILEHQLEGLKFFTLYGHLTADSLEGKTRGKLIAKGEPFAKIGNYPINGEWPPHLHFQVILDLLGNDGDFFGVAAPSKKEYFLTLCPDPNLILGF